MRIVIYSWEKDAGDGPQLSNGLTGKKQISLMMNSAVSQRHEVIEVISDASPKRDEKRPGLIRLMKSATSKPRPYDAVMIYSSSRLFRDARLMDIYCKQLRLNGVEVWRFGVPYPDTQVLDLLLGVVERLIGHRNRSRRSPR